MTDKPQESMSLFERFRSELVAASVVLAVLTGDTLNTERSTSALDERRDEAFEQIDDILRSRDADRVFYNQLLDRIETRQQQHDAKLDSILDVVIRTP